MSTEVIGVYDAGIITIKNSKGMPVNRGALVFRTVTNSAAPEDVTAIYDPIYRDTILKVLNRLTWVKPYIENTKAPDEKK